MPRSHKDYRTPPVLAPPEPLQSSATTSVAPVRPPRQFARRASHGYSSGPATSTRRCNRRRSRFWSCSVTTAVRSSDCAIESLRVDWLIRGQLVKGVRLDECWNRETTAAGCGKSFSWLKEGCRQYISVEALVEERDSQSGCSLPVIRAQGV